MPSATREAWIGRLFGSYWIAYLSVQIAIARFATIDTYDAFLYLRNARRLAGAVVGYDDSRPPIPALLHAPLQGALELCRAGLMTRIWAPHLLEALVTIAWLGAFYLYLRRSFSPRWAELGAVLLSFNRAVIHYFHSVMADIPCALFLLLFLLALRAEEKESRRDLVAAGALAACLLCRWNMGALPVLVAAALALTARDRMKSLAKLTRLTALAAAFFALVLLGVYARLDVGPVLGAKSFFFQLHATLASVAGPEPARAYWDELMACSGSLAAVLTLLAAALVVAGQANPGAFELAILTLYFIVMIIGVGHRETRYLLPVLPLYYFLALLAARRAAQALTPVLSASAKTGVAVLLAGSCAIPAAREWRDFLDPIYRAPVIVDTARAVSESAPATSAVYWSGAAHALVGGFPPLAPQDPWLEVYHVPSRASLEYLLGRPVLPCDRPPERGDVIVEVDRDFYMPGHPMRPDEERILVRRIR